MTMALLPLAAFGLIAAAYDWKTRRIPNWLCMTTTVVGLAMARIQGTWFDVGTHALHVTVALLAGMLFFRLRVVGGGDAKFYAAIAAWFGIADGAALLVDTSLAGLLLFLCWVAVRRMMGIPFRIREPSAFDLFPYGIAISAGALLTAWGHSFVWVA
uniref:A24 family peptidase n=1 Tax=Altererythrobacter segetis TaxID=1104773 RepID=UPI00140C21E4|nr:prepilin peptidase [Altererythrobacter segetis]